MAEGLRRGGGADSIARARARVEPQPFQQKERALCCRAEVLEVLEV